MEATPVEHRILYKQNINHPQAIWPRKRQLGNWRLPKKSPILTNGGSATRQFLAAKSQCTIGFGSLVVDKYAIPSAISKAI